MYMTQTSLLVVSAAFLGDALRLLGLQFKKDQRLQVNRQTMTLHVLALFLHTICMMFFQIGRVYYFKSIGTPHQETWAVIWNWGRLAMYLSGVISEVIVIYLFLEFSRPVSLKKEI